HARSRYLQRSRLGQTLDRVLACDVNRRARPTCPAEGGRYVDDTALPLRQHHAQLMLQAQQCAQHIRVEGARVALSGLLNYRAGLAFGTCIVDGHVQAANRLTVLSTKPLTSS